MSYNFTASQEEEMLNLIQKRMHENINTHEWGMLKDMYIKISEAFPTRSPDLIIECPECGNTTYPDAYRTEDEDQFTRICNGCGKVFSITELVDARKQPNPHCWMLMVTPTGEYVDLIGGKQEAIEYARLRKSALGDNPDGIQIYAVQELPLTPQSEPKTGGTRDLQEKNDV